MRLSRQDRIILRTNALDLLGVKDAVQRRDAYRSILIEVYEFRRNSKHADAAPRLSDIKEALPEIRRHARKLYSLLRSRWYPHGIEVVESLDLLGLVPGNPNSIDDPYANPEIRDFVALNPVSVMSGLPKLIHLMKRLESSWPSDPGGGRTLYTMSRRNPKALLAESCYHIFAEHRPAEAAGSPGGDFYRFTAAVYELAAEQGADEPGVGLSKYVARTASFLNRMNPLHRELNEVRRCLHGADLSDADRAVLEARYESIIASIKAVPAPF